jgi:hypothetical protein
MEKWDRKGTWLPVMPVTTRSFDIVIENVVFVVVGCCEDEEKRNEDNM